MPLIVDDCIPLTMRDQARFLANIEGSNCPVIIVASQEVLLALTNGRWTVKAIFAVARQITAEASRVYDATEGRRVEPGPRPASTPLLRLFYDDLRRPRRRQLAGVPMPATRFEPLADARPRRLRGRR